MEYRESGGGGSTTPFESMSHETMLAWLDQANSGQVQNAADRLVAAATEIRNIAQQLKFRPERVEWKGQGAEAFLAWGASLASATFRLADYSDEASKWMGRASDAIAEAQSAIPRDEAGSKANLKAARDFHNDPDSQLIAQKAHAELRAGAEQNRLEAAMQMRKLAQSYQQASTQMGQLEKPTFQPPPDEFLPEEVRRSDALSRDVHRSGTNDIYSGDPAYTVRPTEGGGARPTVVPHTVTTSPDASSFGPSSSHSVVGSVEQPVSMEIDAVLPSTQPPAGTPSGVGVPPAVGRPDGITPPVAGVIPPAFAGPVVGREGGGAAVGGVGRGVPGARSPMLGGQVPAGSSGPVSRMPQNGGIVGGRPVPPAGGRPTGGIPRGTVIGGEQNQGRAPMGRAPGAMGGGMGGQGGGAVGGQAGSAGRRLASQAGGAVGGRPTQPGGRPFTQGGSGLVRGAAGQRGTGRREDEQSGERPDYLTEDEETWQQGGRRVGPPVVD